MTRTSLTTSRRLLRSGTRRGSQSSTSWPTWSQRSPVTQTSPLRSMTARQQFGEQHPNLVVYLAGFEIDDDSLFGKSVFSSDIRRLLSPQKYWQYARKVSELPEAKQFCEVMESFSVCPASSCSAGLERVFSSFSLVHDKLRNRLGNKKVAKLVKVYCSFRNDSVSSASNFEELENISD